MVSRRNFLKVVGGTGAALVTYGCGGGGEQRLQPPTVETPAPTPPTPPPPPPPPPQSKGLETLEHIIFTMQENRSFDHYFGKMPEYRRKNNIPGADDIDGWPADASNPALQDVGVGNSIDPSKPPVTPYHISTQCHENLSCTWNESHRNWNFFEPSSDAPKLDGFVAVAGRWSRANRGASPTPVDFAGRRAMGFYTEEDIPFYYALASQFAMSDRHFCSLLSHTLPNRLYLLGGSSFGHINSLRPEEGDTIIRANSIFDVLDEAGISWKIYMRDKDVPGSFTFYSGFTGYNRKGGKANPNIVDAEQFFADAASGNLPKVAMIESGVNTGLDEHPRNDVQAGVAYMSRFFRALMKSPVWTKSAMILTYDEHGAFYDHVVPPKAVKPDDMEPVFPNTGDVRAAFDRLGFRVPLVVVSPWVKKHFVSHEVTDHTSILKLIERRFNLPPLTKRDGAANDFSAMFDFNQMSWEQPPELPEQPTDGVCQPALVDD
jgi:phospholipase C